MTQLNDALPTFVLMSRIVVGLMVVLLLVMPLSERYSMLDNFPHGQDAELSLLGVLMILGLALLFARSSRQAFGALFASLFACIRAMLAGVFPASLKPVALVGRAYAPSLPGSPPGAFNLPLQI